jgi:hypothetical protein
METRDLALSNTPIFHDSKTGDYFMGNATGFEHR